MRCFYDVIIRAVPRGRPKDSIAITVIAVAYGGAAPRTVTTTSTVIEGAYATLLFRNLASRTSSALHFLYRAPTFSSLSPLSNATFLFFDVKLTAASSRLLTCAVQGLHAIVFLRSAANRAIVLVKRRMLPIDYGLP